nr:MAG TPA: Poxvirus A21 Protein [Bacteriophage sp.]DAO70000.1 MAG TPA: Poxvirus A21 Protein [Bacteriophage sp.]
MLINIYVCVFNLFYIIFFFKNIILYKILLKMYKSPHTT